MPGETSPGKRRASAQRNRLILVFVWLFTAIAVLPAIFHWAAPAPRISRSNLALQLAYVAAAIICYRIYRAESRRLTRAQSLAITLMIFLLTSVTNQIHYAYIDQGTNLFVEKTNERWQEGLQNNVINLVPGVAPHSYRFLPNAIVRWIELGHVRFPVARDIYRLLCGLLLFYAIYRYARLYTNFAGAVLAMVLVAVVYPVSFEGYSGQLTDPLSHLSFVLAFIFLETENFPLFLTSLLIGSLAKETVLALAGYYVLFCRKDTRYALKAISVCAASIAIYFGVRFFVLHGSIAYQQVSGVTPEHIAYNWTHYPWAVVFLLTACVYIPFLALGWKITPASLKQMYFYLLPVLLVSGLLFSWLSEARNYMPATFVLAVIAARYLNRSESPDSAAALS